MSETRRLYWWTKRLAAGEGGRRRGADEVRFVPAIVKVDTPRVGSGPAITIRVGTKAAMEIVVPSLVSAVWVAEVMTEVPALQSS